VVNNYIFSLPCQPKFNSRNYENIILLQSRDSCTEFNPNSKINSKYSFIRKKKYRGKKAWTNSYIRKHIDELKSCKIVILFFSINNNKALLLLCMNNISHDRLENIPGRKIGSVFFLWEDRIKSEKFSDFNNIYKKNTIKLK
jgi:hypothetical protein